MASRQSQQVAAYKGTLQIVDVGQFIRFADGTKLSTAAYLTAQNNPSQAAGDGRQPSSQNVLSSNPIDVGQYRCFEADGMLIVAVKDVTARNTTGEVLLNGFRVMFTLQPAASDA